MRHILWILLLGSGLYAITLDEAIERALKENPSLEAIHERILAGRSAVDASDQFSNPEISYVQNTLDNRQAMSQKIVTLKQKLPYYGKRESMQKVALAQDGVLQESLVKAQAGLVYAIKEEAYTVWELERVYAITCGYEELTKQNIDLHESYSSISDSHHLGIMSATLKLSDLRIQKSMLNAKINASYARLSYLLSFELSDLELDLDVSDMPGMSDLEKGLENNRDVALKEQELRREQARVKAAELNNYPDVTLLAGYSFRERFDDYATFGVGVSLPIYGTEDDKEQEARRLALSAQSMKEDMKVSVDAQFQSSYAQMKSAYETYHIIHDEVLPQIEHMFDLSSSSISTGSDLFKYMDILLQKLKLEQKSINAVADYNRARAKISLLSGELR